MKKAPKLSVLLNKKHWCLSFCLPLYIYIHIYIEAIYTMIRVLGFEIRYHTIQDNKT